VNARWPTLGIVTLLALAADPALAGEWRYVLPPPGDSFEHPPLRVLALSSQKPDDLKEHVRYRGQRQCYAQIRYGSPRSVAVAVVVDEVSATEVDLYVDTSRSRVLSPKDRVQGSALTWRVPLDVAVVEGNTIKLLRRAVLFRLGRVSRTLSYAACGYLEGKSKLGNQAITIRRIDGDGNGFFADAQDRVWIDPNQDGRWDEIEEQFLFAPILRLGATRYAVRADALGNRLEFDKLEGTGTVRLAVKRPGLAERVESLTATLIGRDGSVISLQGKDASATLPIGEYRMTVLTLALQDPGGGPLWNYVFSDDGTTLPRKWYKVEPGRSQTIDPVGKLTLLTGLGEEERASRSGETLRIQPQLYTGDRLLINTAYRGDQAPAEAYRTCSAEVILSAMDGQILDAHGSGFA
jgi:hypothetical protein